MNKNKLTPMSKYWYHKKVAYDIDGTKIVVGDCVAVTAEYVERFKGTSKHEGELFTIDEIYQMREYGNDLLGSLHTADHNVTTWNSLLSLYRKV